MRGLREAVAATAEAAVITAVLVAGTFAYGRADLALPGAAALAVLAVAGHRVVGHLREPGATVRGVPAAEEADQGFTRLRWLQGRLDYGTSSAHHFDGAVRPLLTELADERLRRRHGIDRARRPEAARAVLGEPLWRLLTEPTPDPPPGLAALERHVRRIEEL